MTQAVNLVHLGSFVLGLVTLPQMGTVQQGIIAQEVLLLNNHSYLGPSSTWVEQSGNNCHNTQPTGQSHWADSLGTLLCPTVVMELFSASVNILDRV